MKQSALDSVVDRDHFAVDPDLGPTFHCDADSGKVPDPNLDLDLHMFKVLILFTYPQSSLPIFFVIVIDS